VAQTNGSVRISEIESEGASTFPVPPQEKVYVGN